MFSRLNLVSEHPARVSVCTIYKITNNIADPSSFRLKVYVHLKTLNLRLALVVRELLIHRPSILDLRRC